MSLKIRSDEALTEIASFLMKIEELLKIPYDKGSDDKNILKSEIIGFINAAFTDSEKKVKDFQCPYSRSVAEQGIYIYNLKTMRNNLIEYKKEIETSEFHNAPVIDDIKKLEIIFTKFHSVAQQLKRRHDNRETLKVNDEYDVQDLLHSILKIFFEDIRHEEYTPSYAGGHRRMDFLFEARKHSYRSKDDQRTSY